MNGVYMCRKCHDEAGRFPAITKGRIQELSPVHYVWFSGLSPLDVVPMPDMDIRDIYVGLRSHAKKCNLPVED